MNVQLTDFGISLLNETSKPLKISRYVLGSAFGYTPESSQTGIKGNSVYAGNLTGPQVINANVYSYTILLGYQIGNFTFGEVAFYDAEDKCVAIAVSDISISKSASSNGGAGNSIRLDCYLSMVNGSFNTWGEYIGSDIKSQVPIVDSLDNLPPVHKSDPNFYIVAPSSDRMSTVLAYTAGRQGLWHFDCYSFDSIQSLTVLSATPTAITVDTTGVNEISDLANKFFGDKVVEFSSGACYSICRVVLNAMVQRNKAVISFKTPLAILPQKGDTFLYFSRTPISASEIQIASHDSAGVVMPDESFNIDSTNGKLSIASIDCGTF